MEWSGGGEEREGRAREGEGKGREGEGGRQRAIELQTEKREQLTDDGLHDQPAQRSCQPH